MDEQSQADSLLREFKAIRPVYESLGGKVAELLSQLLGDKGIQIHSINCRCKTEESLEGKIRRPGKDYSALADITDLAGIRVITYFSEDVERVAEIVEELFDIDAKRSIDKRALLDPDRFGYQSLHYIASYTIQRVNFPENKKFGGKFFEIQIRSILQHAWAEIEHDLGYKSENGVPHDIRRRFARVAGLLEVADAEFDALKAALNKYETDVQREIEADSESVLLDLASLKAYIDNVNTIRDLDSSFAKALNGSLAPRTTNYDAPHEMLATVNYLGIKTISELEKVLRSNFEEIVYFAKSWIKSNSPIFGGGVVVFYLAYVILAAEGSVNHLVEYLERFKIVMQEGRRLSFANELIEKHASYTRRV